MMRIIFSDADQSRIVERYAAGESLDMIAESCHVSRPVIRRIVVARGGQIRSRGVPDGYAWSDSARAEHRAACQTPEARERSREVMLRLHATGRIQQSS